MPASLSAGDDVKDALRPPREVELVLDRRSPGIGAFGANPWRQSRVQPDQRRAHLPQAPGQLRVIRCFAGPASRSLASNRPETPFSSAAVAVHTLVRAPSSCVRMNGRLSADSTRQPSETRSPCPMLVRTTPGCTQLAVTPVPARRRASS